MDNTLTTLSERIRWGGFVVVLVLALGAYIAYGINLASWKDSTDYGWRAMYDSGPHIVDEVFGLGWQAGLRPGDRILFINGRSYETFDDLFFNIRNREPGEPNSYTIIRSGEPIDINIINGVLGYRAVMKRSGPLFIVGLLYVFIGLLVYLMKPGARESRVFLLMTAALGVAISYASPSDLMRPLGLFQLRQFFDVFLPAPIIHLALIFPRPRKVMDPGKLFWVVPYMVSLVIFYYFRPFTATYWDPPAGMDLVNNLYLLAAVLIFIGFTLLNFHRKVSPLVRIQSRMVLFGIIIGFLIPVLELVARNLGDLHFFADPVVSFALLFSAFPICVGYTIVKHDLFTIDITVRRTFGYALSTAAFVVVYIFLVVIINLTVPSVDIERSRIFTALFAVSVVLTFKPLYERVQRVVDRKFYRVKLDYKDTVIEISNDLTSFFNMGDITARIIHAGRNIMSIDSAGIMVLDPENEECQTLFVHDGTHEGGEEELSSDCLELDHPVVAIMKREKNLVTIFDLEESADAQLDPGETRGGSLEDTNETLSLEKRCLECFHSFNAVIALPLLFQNDLIGILVLGRKKSGRFYAKEDIDLLKTLANQGAVAIANAKMAEKMKNEEVVRGRLAQYLPPQVIDEVIKDPAGRSFGGESKNVAILISDIRGFTKLTRSQPPDLLVEILNEYRTEMVRIIFEHGGSLDKYVGDAIVAIFGGFMQLSNPTSSAVKAAIDMVNQVSRLNKKWIVEYNGLYVDVGYGIDCGEVFIGNVGSPDRMEYTVIGDAVNTAKYLSDVAKPDQIVLSETAGDELGSEINKVKMGNLLVLKIVK